MNSVLVVAGEKSGEDHALSFFDELTTNFPKTNFYGVGGDQLSARGLEIIYHLKEFSSFGISEVITKIPFYYRAIDKLYFEVKKRQTKIAILIDFQTFNLKLAVKLKKLNVLVHYYVAPQAWAWKAYRTKILAKTVAKLYCILPFEKKWFQERGVTQAVSIGHPLRNSFSLNDLQIEKKLNLSIKEEIKILLLPGSRNSEVKYILPVFNEAIKLIKDKNYKVFVSIVKSESVEESNYPSRIYNKTYKSHQIKEAIIESDIAIAASGTVTLSCALGLTPTIVCYKGSHLNYFIFKDIIKYDQPVSLANIIHSEKVFKEFLQNECTGYNITIEFEKIVQDKMYFNKMIKKLLNTNDLLKGELSSPVSAMSSDLREVYQQELQ